MRVALIAAVAGSLFSIGIAPAVASAAPMTTTEPVERSLSSTEVRFVDRSDLVATEPLSFDAWSPLDDATGIRVYFLSGTPACYGVNTATTETADTVTVALQSGLLPEAADRRCSAKGVLGAVDIVLDAPVGERRVLTRY